MIKKCNFKDNRDCTLKYDGGGEYYVPRCDGEKNCILYQIYNQLIK